MGNNIWLGLRLHSLMLGTAGGSKGVKPQNIESHVKVGVADIRYT